MVSFSCNCSVAALKDSSLLRDIKALAPDENIKEDFLLTFYENEIIDAAICFYHDAVFNKKQH